MKKTLLILICPLFALFVNAQQISLSSQYMFNDFLINPAIAGVKDYLPISLAVRRQWTGFKEAPVTQSIAAHGYIGLNLGCGGYIINEVTGPTRRTAGNFSVAYHLKLTKSPKKTHHHGKVLSFGLAVNLSQHKYDLAKLTTFEPDDAALLNTLNYQVIPDANVGIYFHDGNKYYAGVSVFHLVQTNRDLFEVVTPFYNGFKRQYYITGGYNINLENNFSVQPSFVAEMIESKPFQIDVNAKFIYKKQYWIGLGYRLKDAAIVALGLQKGLFRLGYSYDYPLSDIKEFTSGSHEISLTVFLFYGGNGGDRKGVVKKRENEFQPAITDY